MHWIIEVEDCNKKWKGG